MEQDFRRGLRSGMKPLLWRWILCALAVLGGLSIASADDLADCNAALLEHIGTPKLEVNQMLTRVRIDVAAATEKKQVPWVNSSLLGEVFLTAAKK